MTSKETKRKRKLLKGSYAKSNKQVIVEWTDIKQAQTENVSKGLNQFLNKHFRRTTNE